MKTTHVYVLCLLFFIPFYCLGQVNPRKFHIELLELMYNEDLKLQFMEEIPIDFRVVYRRNSDGKRKVKIFRNNHAIKKHFSIETKQGRYHEGELYYRRKDVFRNGGNIDLRIRDKLGSGFSKEFQLHVPLLQAIDMRYDDSHVGPGKRIPIELILRYEGGFAQNMYSPRGTHARETNFPKVEDIRIQSDERVVLERKSRNPGLLRSLIEPSARKKQLFLIPSLSCPEEILLQAELIHYPGIVGELKIPMTYNASYAYNFDGGYSQSDALPLDIYLKKIRHRDRDLLWIKVQNAEKTEETLFDPLLGSVNISCRGRRGGDGMDGTDGSDGSKDPPSDGCDGSSGYDGDNGGDGSFVSIYTDAESTEFLHLLYIDNSGGQGGEGGNGGDGGDGGPGKCDGSDGRDGSDGLDGRDGPPPKRIFLSSQTLRDMINLTGKLKEQ